MLGAMTIGAPSPRMPAAFIGHGSPMNALERNRYTDAWRTFAAAIPRPRAILAISAHWYTNATAVTAMARPRTIHDFYGFPDSLFAVEYPAPGSPEVADEVVRAVDPVWVGLDHDTWGIDHGSWSVLRHMYPNADVPVVQLSIDATKPLEYHLDLGSRLAALRDQGILILGSGNIVHNLGRMDPSRPDQGFDWAQRFDRDARAILTEDPASIADLRRHADFALAVPTPDHFLPSVFLAGLAAASGESLEVLVDGCAYGSLSMAAYGLGAGPVHEPAEADSSHAGSLPDPVVPLASSNL
jgi:4,5-DOPA dioxygenase extradiol